MLTSFTIALDIYSTKNTSNYYFVFPGSCPKNISSFAPDSAYQENQLNYYYDIRRGPSSIDIALLVESLLKNRLIH